MGTSRKPKTTEEIAQNVKTAKGESSVSRSHQKKKVDAALARAKDVSPEKVAEDMTAVGLDVGRALNTAQQKVIEKLQEADQLQLACDTKVAELEELHDKEQVLLDLSILTEQYEAKKADLLALEQKRIDDELEYNNALQMKRERDEAEYAYTLKIKHRTEDDTRKDLIASEMLKHSTAINAMTEASQRLLAERENIVGNREDVIADAEEELIELRTLKAGYDEAINAARKQGIGMGEKSKQGEMELAALKLDQTQKQDLALSQQRERIANDRVAQLQSDLSQMQLKLDEANKRVESVSAKAFEAMSGQASMNALQGAIGSNNTRGRSDKPQA